MAEPKLVNRRQALVLGCAAAGAALVPAPARAAEPVAQESPDRPCVGQPGYAERMARLFGAQTPQA